MSASAIIDGLITNLTAASVFGPGGASRDYGVLESSSGSCAVIQWLSVDESESMFADSTEANAVDTNWTISVTGYVKDLGNPRATLIRVTSLVDTVMATLRSDRTIQGTAEKIVSIRGTRELPPGGAIESGGAVWLEVPFEIDCLEYPLG